MNKEFLSVISHFRPKIDEPLAGYTTWKVGGPADVLVKVNNSNELGELLELATKYDIDYVLLGGGSNILIPDEGLRKLVIINNSMNVEVLETPFDSSKKPIDQIEARHAEVGSGEFVDYEDSGERVLVKFDSGVHLRYAVNWTLEKEITGLHWFAGIPGSMGGALFNNIHGAKKHFSDYFYEATIFTSEGGVEVASSDFFDFGYDQSILRQKSDIMVLDITLALYKGNAEKAVETMKKWLQNKKIQSWKTSGCTFKNISKEKQEELNLPTNSTGYIIDKVLNLGGATIGGAKISASHANFIVNTGGATASDILQLIDLIKTNAKRELNLDLELEIRVLG